MSSEKGEIIDIGKFEDEFRNKEYRVVVVIEKRPNLKLGECEVKQ